MPSSVKMEETILNACRASYKKGLIDAAQAVCRRCSESRPLLRRGQWEHNNVWICEVPQVIELLEAAGGWQAAWPNPGQNLKEGNVS